MSDSARAADSGAQSTGPTSPRPARAGDKARRGLFARIAVFVRQVVAELKKVVRPTRTELIRYTSVVLVFVVVVMAFVTVVDLGVGSLVGWVFGG
ncbi:MAG: preprotein translocase subunit SecE [Cellulomonadaceae bacterium]|nr:preprotein translocase subunit SecE [Cellulomonadaceae bacterium]